MKLGYGSREIEIEDESVTVVYAHPPNALGPSIFLYFQDAAKDVGRIEFSEELARKVAYLINDSLASNRPTRPSL